MIATASATTAEPVRSLRNHPDALALMRCGLGLSRDRFGTYISANV
jgi:hypothetical protein